MNSQPPSPGRTEWTGYATLTLILVFVGALAEALQVPQSLNEFFNKIKNPEEVISKEIPPPPHSPLPVIQTEVCAHWSSENSSRQYSFICVGAENLDIYEVNNGRLIKIGSGRFSDGKINAEVVSLTKNRRGYWQLELSSDKTTLEGSWQGDDPRESGNLKLRKVV